MHMIEIPSTPGTIRLETVMPGVIRCVHTLGKNVAEPSELVAFNSNSDFDSAVLPDGVRAGSLTARVDAQTGCLAWFVHDQLLIQEDKHVLIEQDVVRYTTGNEPPVIERVKTVDGERSFIRNLRPVADHRALRAGLIFRFAEDEGVYGLGQGEEGVWNWRGHTQYLYQHNMRIPMPFLLSSRGYGVFVDCSSLMTFHDAAGEGTLWLDTVAQLDYYIIAGSYKDIIASLRRLTGRATLLPRWAFGYIQSRERYNTAAELEEVVRRYRELGVPLDGVVQDWHTWREGCWGEKRLDPARYGDLKEQLDSIHNMHAHAMVSIWPNMNQGTSDNREFLEAGWLLNDLSTYDAFNSEARDLYWRQAKRELFNSGFDAWWCDSTEPFSGPDWGGEALRAEVERFELVGGELKRFLPAEKANVYAVAHAKGIYENQRRDAPEKRVLNLTRSGYASSQRYGAVLWSGDISARWDVMRSQIAEMLNMAASGYPWWTLDIGGFFVVNENWRARGCDCSGDPTPKWFWKGSFEAGIEDPGFRELYVRWLQFGCFLPMFRSHGTDVPREIWNFGKPGEPFYDSIARFIRLRYRLLPYIYSLAGMVWREDGMIIRPLLFEFPEDRQAVECATEYMFGPSLLVCPVTEPMRFAPGSKAIHRAEVWTCYLPDGCEWIDFWEGVRYAGGQSVTVPAPLDRIPLFVKAGSILPMMEKGLNYADDISAGPLEIWIYPGSDAVFNLYEDAGDGYGYERGEYSLTAICWNDSDQQIEGLRDDMVPLIVKTEKNPD